MKAARTQRDILNHPLVKSLHQEDDDGLSWWCYLKEGWMSIEMECGTIHERTIQGVCDKINSGIIKKA